MKTLLFIILTLPMLGCEKEYFTLSYANVQNASIHTIKALIYSKGNPNPAYTLKFSTSGSFELGSSTSRGKNDFGFSSKYFEGADSIQIIFDDLYKISHYVSLPSTLSRKYYPFNSKRNIMNRGSYNLVSEDESKLKRINRFTYTFTEQDYLDAR